MRVTKRQLKRIIREEAMRLREDSIADELEHLRKNREDDIQHIDALEKDIEDDREEAERAKEAERRKHEGFSRRNKRTRRRLRSIIREEIQGYDAREDERLGAEYGALSGKDFVGSHEEEERSRRDDAEFEDRHRRHHHKMDQGYDDREDERLGMEHGRGSEHDQDYKDRRDDAGFEVRHESMKRQVRRIVRETTGRRHSKNCPRSRRRR